MKNFCIRNNKILKFFIVGVSLVFIDFIFFSILVFVSNNRELSAIISGIIATIIAYFMHGLITWEIKPSNKSIQKFIFWNLFMNFLMRPILVVSGSYLLTLFPHQIKILSTFLGISFSIASNSIVFLFMNFFVMLLNYIAYNFFVFKDKR